MTDMPSEGTLTTKDSAAQAVQAFREMDTSTDANFQALKEETEELAQVLPVDSLEALTYIIGDSLYLSIDESFALALMLELSGLGWSRPGAVGDPAASQPTL